MDNQALSPRTPLRLSACLLLIGQLLYIAVTQFHAGGDANDHHAIFATYAGDDIWAAVHVGQFAAMAISPSQSVAIVRPGHGSDMDDLAGHNRVADEESGLVAPSFNRRSAASRIPAGMKTPNP